MNWQAFIGEHQTSIFLEKDNQPQYEKFLKKLSSL